MKYFLLTLVAALLVVTAIDQLFSPRAKPASEPVAKFPGEFYSASFDGHRWIVCTTFHGLHVLHHPDCPCGKLEKP